MLLDFPDVLTESTAELCHNSIDDDRDGVLDCQDTDCLRFCFEDREQECTDGEDNDSDGLFDGDDPLCWHVTPPSFRTCAAASNVEFVETFGIALDRRWESPTGVSVAGTLSIGRSDERRDAAILVDVPPLESGQGVGTRESFSSSTGDVRLSGTFKIPDGGGVMLALVEVGRLESGVPEGSSPAAVLKRDGDQVELVLISPSLGELRTRATVGESDWGAFRVRFRAERGDDELWLQMQGGAVSTLKRVAPNNRAFHLIDVPHRLLVGRAEAGSEPVLLDDLRLEELGRQACVQQPAGNTCSANAELLAHTVSSDGNRCALVLSAQQLQAWTSDDGFVWEAAGAASLDLKGATPSAELAWDSRSRSFRAAILLKSADSDERNLVLLSSEDCAGWTELGRVSLDPISRDLLFGIERELVGYVVQQRSEQSLHQLFFTRTLRADLVVERLVSNDGISFDTKPSRIGGLPSRFGLGARVAGIGMQDLVLLYQVDDTSLAFAVPPVAINDTGEFVPDWERLLQGPSGPLIEASVSESSEDHLGVSGAIPAFLLNGEELTTALYSAVSEGGQTIAGACNARGSDGLPNALCTVRSAPLDEACGDGMCFADEVCLGGEVDEDSEMIPCPQDCGACGDVNDVVETLPLDAMSPWQLPEDGAIHVIEGQELLAWTFDGAGEVVASTPMNDVQAGRTLYFVARMEKSDRNCGVALGLGARDAEVATKSGAFLAMQSEPSFAGDTTAKAFLCADAKCSGQDASEFESVPVQTGQWYLFGLTLKKDKAVLTVQQPGRCTLPELSVELPLPAGSLDEFVVTNLPPKDAGICRGVLKTAFLSSHVP